MGIQDQVHLGPALLVVCPYYRHLQFLSACQLDLTLSSPAALCLRVCSGDQSPLCFPCGRLEASEPSYSALSPSSPLSMTGCELVYYSYSLAPQLGLLCGTLHTLHSLPESPVGFSLIHKAHLLENKTFISCFPYLSNFPTLLLVFPETASRINLLHSIP